MTAQNIAQRVTAAAAAAATQVRAPELEALLGELVAAVAELDARVALLPESKTADLARYFLLAMIDGAYQRHGPNYATNDTLLGAVDLAWNMAERFEANRAQRSTYAPADFRQAFEDDGK